MSPKSRPPKAGKQKKGKKGKKGEVAEGYTVVEEAGGPPFGIVVLIAIVLSIPSIIQFVDGTMAFDATALRFLAGLAVAWLLVHLVYAVAHSFGPKEETTSTTMSYSEDGFRPDANSPYRTSEHAVGAEDFGR